MQVDEKTGKVSSSTSPSDKAIATNIDDFLNNEKMVSQKVILLQQSNSLPEILPSPTNPLKSSPSLSTSSSNNQSTSSSGTKICNVNHGKHVILTMEDNSDDRLNQMNRGKSVESDSKKIKMNIESSSASDSSCNIDDQVTGSVSA